MEAIFGSAEHAVHVAFYIQSLEPRRAGGLRVVLIHALEELGKLSRAQERFLDYLRGEPSSTINFGGLTGDEVRAQCAMVVAAVDDHLRRGDTPADDWTDERVDERKAAIWLRHAYGLTRRRGILAFEKFVAPKLAVTNRTAVRALVAAHSYPAQREKDLSYAEIVHATGVPLRTLERAAFQIRKHCAIAHTAAIDALTPMFERDGICPSAAPDKAQA